MQGGKDLSFYHCGPGFAPNLSMEISQFAASTITYGTELHMNVLAGLMGVQSSVHILALRNYCNYSFF